MVLHENASFCIISILSLRCTHIPRGTQGIKLAEGTARMHGNSPFAAGESEEAATNTSSLSHMPHHIQISQIPPNRSTPSRIGFDFRMIAFSAFHASMQNCIASILLVLTITSSRKYHESPLDHHRPARDHGDGPRGNSVFSNT
jgi:hypothetical protein